MPLPVITVALDDGSGTFPYDISAYVRLSEGISIKRGRQDEFATIDAGTANLTLDNRDGRFTLGHSLAASTYGLRVDQGIRITETIGGVPAARFTGYVDAWPTTWNTPTGSKARAEITAVDGLARLQRQPLESMAIEEITLRNPLLFFPLSSATAYRADDSWGGSPTAPLNVIGDTGAAPTYTADTTTAAGLEGATGAAFTGGMFLEPSATPPTGTATNTMTLAAVMKISTPPASGSYYGIMKSTPAIVGLGPNGVAVGMNSAGRLILKVIGGSGDEVTTSSSFADGQWHFIAAIMNGASCFLFVDGVQVASATPNLPFYRDTANLRIGGTGSTKYGGVTGSTMVGSLAAIAYYDGALSASTLVAMTRGILYGGSGETGYDRFLRIASYGGWTLSNTIRDVTTDILSAQAINGTSLADALAAITNTEGGATFIDDAGMLNYQGRRTRVDAAAASPTLTIDAAAGELKDTLTLPGDKQFLKNQISGTSGATGNQVMVSSDSSIAKYGTYTDDLGSVLSATDDAVFNALGWRLAQYADPGRPRANVVAIDLLRNDGLADSKAISAVAMEVGSLLRVTGLPSQAPSSSLDLIAEGWTETVSTSGWSMEFNTSPASIYRVFRLDSSQLDGTDPLFY